VVKILVSHGPPAPTSDLYLEVVGIYSW
jgi:hypothetical protein